MDVAQTRYLDREGAALASMLVGTGLWIVHLAAGWEWFAGPLLGGVGVTLPVGLASAAYLSEYAPQRVRRFLKPTLEVLAGVPTVVLGYFALTFMTPLLRATPGQLTTGSIFKAASAGIVTGSPRRHSAFAARRGGAINSMEGKRLAGGRRCRAPAAG